MKFGKLLLVLFFSGWLCQAFAGNQNGTSQLATILNSIKSMRANFVQTISGGQNRRPQTSSGTMAIARPGLFRWQINRPTKQVIVADGKTLWIYNVALEQVTRRPQSSALIGTPARLLSGSVSKLKQNFRVSLIRKSGKNQWFNLNPRSSRSSFKWIQIQFIGNKLTSMRVADRLGQMVSVHFSRVRVNPRLSTSLFRFIPPRGVDVVRGA